MVNTYSMFVQTNPSTFRCASWDFATVSWTTEGCDTIIVDDSTLQCKCTHLTNFAVLIVSGKLLRYILCLLFSSFCLLLKSK